MKKLIIISTTNELVRVLPKQIVYISSDDNYSTIVKETSAIKEDKEKAEPVIPEVQVQETQKPKFLDKFLKRLNDVITVH